MSDWKDNRIRHMKELAKEIVADKKKDEDVSGVLLFGSVAIEDVHPDSDLDVVVIRDSENNLMKDTSLS